MGNENKKEDFSKQIINQNYYCELLEKHITNNNLNSSILPISNFNKINLSFIARAIKPNSGFDFILTIPEYNEKILMELYSNIYLYIANAMFDENRINKEFEVGESVMSKNETKNRRYEIVKINDEYVWFVESKRKTSRNPNGPSQFRYRKKDFQNQYLPIKRSLKKKSLNNYLDLFKELNNLEKQDFFPTKFNSISVFIGAKNTFDRFRDIQVTKRGGNLFNCIPCNYINKDGIEIDTLGITPLCYYTTSYSTAYEYIQYKKNIKNIILLNEGFDEIQQIISDKYQYGFRIIGVFDKLPEKKIESLKYWKWHKEEVGVIENL